MSHDYLVAMDLKTHKALSIQIEDLFLQYLLWMYQYMYLVQMELIHVEYMVEIKMVAIQL